MMQKSRAITVAFRHTQNSIGISEQETFGINNEDEMQINADECRSCICLHN